MRVRGTINFDIRNITDLNDLVNIATSITDAADAVEAAIANADAEGSAEVKIDD